MWTRGASLPPVARLSVKFLHRQTLLALCTKTGVKAYQENRTTLPHFSPSRNLILSTACWKGHNKWSNIKHIKGARDTEIAKKNLLFRNRIVLAIKQNGNNTNTDSNNVLRKVLEEAKSQMVSFGSPWLNHQTDPLRCQKHPLKRPLKMQRVRRVTWILRFCGK